MHDIRTRLRASVRLAGLSLALGVSARALAAPSDRPVPPERQILWQRSLEDALAIAKEEKRPILLAVNMDGESASERITREQYRDPKFVASTRPFVCLMASVFRHTPRDYDEQGRRIPCPRLGEITCGEHIALEPILYDKYLGGDRIAPRHALILPDGTKAFDLTLLFDLRDIDKKLAESAHLAPPVITRAAPAISARTIESEGSPERRMELWSELARARDQRGRAAFEDVLMSMNSRSHLLESAAAIQSAGDAGSIGALRILLPKSELFDDEFIDQLGLTAQGLAIQPALAAAVRDRIGGLGPFPGSPDLGPDAKLLRLLAHLDGKSAQTRSLLLAHYLIEPMSQQYCAAPSREASSALRLAVSDSEVRSLAWLREQDEPLNLSQILRFSEAASLRLKPIEKPSEDMPPEAELERELTNLDREMKAKPDDTDLMQRYGIASLNLARRRMESKGPGVQYLLDDAAGWLLKVTQTHDLWRVYVELARTAYFRGKFEDEVRFGSGALDCAQSRLKIGDEAKSLLRDLKAQSPDSADCQLIEQAAKLLEDREAVEAYRWIGDGNARLLAERSGGTLSIEARGMYDGVEALALVASSMSSDETDWTSFGSFFGALGMNREELAVLQQGALRLPESTVLRSSLNGALWSGGRIDLAPAKAEWILSKHPDSAASMWFAGYAHILGAEDRRRREEPDRAIDEYHAAEERFRESAEKNPANEASVKHYLALSALGRGFAHSIADRRERAAEALEEGVALEPDVVKARDGLDREAIDLLDAALEWRESGNSPVDPMAMIDALERGDPKNAAWARAVSDSELREALRADGRKAAAEGDRYLDVSIAAARRAIALADEKASGGLDDRASRPPGDEASRKLDDEPSRRTLAQSLTIAGERLIQRGDVASARKYLAEAAPLAGEPAPSADATNEAIQELAIALRAKLGDARPVFRPGR
jgi:hypothetical protein